MDKLQKIKDDIMDYLNAFPRCMNIEVICDLGLSKEDWNKATEELLGEGRINTRIKYTSTTCMNKDGIISHSGLVYHEKGCSCGSCDLNG